jgi:hypothetical protein
MLIDPYSHPLIKERLPWKSGRFVMGVGLKPAKASEVFDTTTFHAEYLAQKAERRKEKLERYYPRPVNLTTEEMHQAVETIKSFCPGLALSQDDEYRDEFDQLVSHLSEDVSLWKKENNREWLASIHLCAPNHWAAEDKIGKSFIDSHLPVPKIAPIAQIALKLFEQSVERGPQERMAWGVATDTILNHHPLAPFKGRSFNPNDPELYARVERQTIFPVTKDLLVFTIRTYFIDMAKLERSDRDQIVSCLHSMDEDVLRYKGLMHDREHQIKWLESF